MDKMFDSSFRCSVSSFRCFVMAFRRFGTPILPVDSLFSEVDSAKCQFDSPPGLVCRIIVSPSRFVVSLWRFFVSTRPLREAVIRHTLHEVFA